MRQGSIRRQVLEPVFLPQERFVLHFSGLQSTDLKCHVMENSKLLKGCSISISCVLYLLPANLVWRRVYTGGENMLNFCATMTATGAVIEVWEHRKRVMKASRPEGGQEEITKIALWTESWGGCVRRRWKSGSGETLEDFLWREVWCLWRNV